MSARETPDEAIGRLSREVVRLQEELRGAYADNIEREAAARAAGFAAAVKACAEACEAESDRVSALCKGSMAPYYWSLAAERCRAVTDPEAKP